MAERMLPMARKLESYVSPAARRLRAFRRYATLAALACIVAGSSVGCRSSQQASIPNPFLSADRVPAPPSRIPAVGTAQPYYPGDAVPPLPSVQQSPQPLGALAPSPDITPIPADSTFTTTNSTSASGAIASAEAPVRIPGDERDLRFAALQPKPAASMADVPPTIPPTGGQNTLTRVADSSNPPAPTPTVFRQPAAPAATAPVISNWPPVAAPAAQVSVSPVANTNAQSGLFRDPNVPTQAPPLIQQTAPVPQVATPRIRVPGASERVRENVVPGSVHTTSYQVGMAGGGMQTMVVPPPGFVPASPAPEGSFPPSTNSDGFRPRGSYRNTFGSGASDTSIPTLRVTPG